jgi:glycine/D-amino acid oxidase-like deaminating enzyme
VNAQVLTAIFGAVASIAGGAFGAWFAARLSLGHYFSQRVWDRRAEAYTAIFTALDIMAEWYRSHLKDLMTNRETSDEEDNRRIASYQAANEELRQRLARETWLIPDHARERIARLHADLDSHHGPEAGWADIVLNGRDTIEGAIDDLRRLARADLRVS